MKRSPIKRRTALKRKALPRRVSDKQRIELARRAKLKAELIAEFGEHCMTCHDAYRDWRGISLSHIVALIDTPPPEGGGFSGLSSLSCGLCQSSPG
jgi:hypothetical protein